MAADLEKINDSRRSESFRYIFFIPWSLFIRIYGVAYERFCKYFGDSMEYCGDIAAGRKRKNKAKFTEWRNYAICNFVIGTGARLGTLVAIRMQDIDLKNGIVFYQHTKNKKLQIANLSPQLVKILNDYITMWRYDVEDNDYLFCNVSGEQLTKAGLTQSYREYTHSRGVNKTNIHGLRHTFAIPLENLSRSGATKTPYVSAYCIRDCRYLISCVILLLMRDRLVFGLFGVTAYYTLSRLCPSSLLFPLLSNMYCTPTIF